MNYFPRFILTTGTNARIELSTGEYVEFDLDAVAGPLDIVHLEHPDFLSMYCVLVWCRRRGITLIDVFNDPILIQEYLESTWSLEISP